MAIPPPTDGGYQLWWYYPSMAGNIIFAVLFCILSIAHLIGLALNRIWICVPLVVGGILEIVGYGIRAYANSNTSTVTLYATQSVLILLAPILFAASVYMYLGRLMIATNTTALSPIPTRYLTKLFVCGDVLCFFIQAVGGGMQSVKKLADKQYIAEYVILVGLILQIIFFGVFVVVAVMVHMRMARKGIEEKTVAWRRLLLVLYVVSGLICLRNIFRAIEYGMGTDGYLLQNEWPGFVFDGALMVIALIVSLAWYIGRGSKLNVRYDSVSSTEELKPTRS
ncbi:hypothetical protein M409DRAFT_53731 [Zasmidium cellare ATCC 36951]|uniref:RTA1 like protein n=1 Tax=Zasmidium cellare ATCC 36951 TaxID=1080233 RepID=A0A6A6CNP6_ZASCE|nr:uncharacterized protein M409DRAFT_53731 [Zasmidium cellare ATCC 36951]KAF2167760.1 hypothetical protein M409DRAFT_53731 [Zasmidium cellare ATCC 36951]